MNVTAAHLLWGSWLAYVCMCVCVCVFVGMYVCVSVRMHTIHTCVLTHISLCTRYENTHTHCNYNHFMDLITDDSRHYEIKHNQFSYTAAIQVLCSV
jgi:hypothetical protein